MALTKVSGSVLKNPLSLSGNVSVGGTLTYEDVTNVDSLGIGTFRAGIKVLAGGINAVGVSTISSSGDVLTIGAATNATRNLIFSADRGADAEFGSIIAKNTGGNIAAISFYAGDDGTNKDNGQIVFRTSPHSGQPLFERMRLTEGGNLLLGINEAHTTVLGGRSPRIQLESTGVDQSSIFLSRDGNDGGGPYLFLGHGRGGNGLIQDGDNLGNLMFVGGTGSSFRGAANISCLVDIPSGGAASNTSMPGALVLSTSNHNQTSPVEAMRIRPDGRIVMGGSSAVSFTPHANADDLVVGATSAANRGITILGGNNNRASIYFGDTDDNDVGQIDYSHNSNAMAFHTNANERLRIDSSGHISQGGLTTPATTNGNIGRMFGIKSTANNFLIGETTQSGANYGFHIESRQTGRSGNARFAQIGLQNNSSGAGEIKFFTAASGADITERVAIQGGGLKLNGGSYIMEVYAGHGAPNNNNKVMDQRRWMWYGTSSSTHTVARVAKASSGQPGDGDSYLAAFIVTYTTRSMYGFNSDGGYSVMKMRTGRINGNNNTVHFSTEKDSMGTGSGSQNPTIVFTDEGSGVVRISITNPSSTHSFGEINLMTYDCRITLPSG